MKKTTSFALSLAVLVGSVSFAKDAVKPNPYTEGLASIPSAEMPAKAAYEVQHAKNRERAEATADIVKAALALNPAAAPAVVAAIANATPTMASIAAGVAASEQPKQAAMIAKAAAAAAPSQTRKIVMAVCRSVPNAYRDIAVAVAEVVPTADKQILSGVAAAIPGLKPYIDQAMVAGNGSSVGSVLDQASRIAQTTTAPGSAASIAATPNGVPQANANLPVAQGSAGPSTVRGPAVGPPYVPLISTPTNVTSGTSGQVPPGGRSYAHP
jgi:hypothetical protein